VFTLSQCSSLNVSGQISHPCKTTSQIIVLYILIFNFLQSRLDHLSNNLTNIHQVWWYTVPVILVHALNGDYICEGRY